MATAMEIRHMLLILGILFKSYLFPPLPIPFNYEDRYMQITFWKP